MYSIVNYNHHAVIRLSMLKKKVKKKRQVYEVVDMLTGLIVEIISQCICKSNHHIVHLKYIQCLSNITQ